MSGSANCHCGSSDVRMIGRSRYKDDRRPVFACGSCGERGWTAGIDGEPYATHCREREAKRKPHEPHYWNEDALYPTDE